MLICDKCGGNTSAAPIAVAESLSVRAKPSSAVKFMDLQDRVKIYLNEINKDIAWCLRNTSGEGPVTPEPTRIPR